MFSFLKRRRIADVMSSIPADRARRQARVLVVDDEEDSFPCQLLRHDGYNIDYWSSVNSAGLERIERGDFDIVVLDVKGIAEPTLSPSDGIGILERVKKCSPDQIIVAFSQHEYDLGKSQFWRLADDALDKPVSYIQCKDLLDRLIEKAISPARWWATVASILQAQGAGERDLVRVERQIIRSLGSKDPSIARTILDTLVADPKLLSRALSLVEKIMGMAS